MLSWRVRMANNIHTHLRGRWWTSRAPRGEINPRYYSLALHFSGPFGLPLSINHFHSCSTIKPALTEATPSQELPQSTFWATFNLPTKLMAQHHSKFQPRTLLLRLPHYLCNQSLPLLQLLKLGSLSKGMASIGSSAPLPTHRLWTSQWRPRILWNIWQKFTLAQMFTWDSRNFFAKVARLLFLLSNWSITLPASPPLQMRLPWKGKSLPQEQPVMVWQVQVPKEPGHVVMVFSQHTKVECGGAGGNLWNATWMGVTKHSWRRTWETTGG